jgi:hypothetical protein
LPLNNDAPSGIDNLVCENNDTSATTLPDPSSTDNQNDSASEVEYIPAEDFLGININEIPPPSGAQPNDPSDAGGLKL